MIRCGGMCAHIVEFTSEKSNGLANSFPVRGALLADQIWPSNGLARTVLLALGGTAALALSAKVQVPFWPVPMTMQSLVVLLIGIGYGSRLAAITLLAYIAEGFSGLPVFAGSSAGPAYKDRNFTRASLTEFIKLADVPDG